MRRSHANADSSLELLLDTMCNTFGGVLFLAILIVVVLRTTGEMLKETAQSEVSRVKEQELETEYTQILTKLQSARTAATQRRKLAEQFARPETMRGIKELNEQRARRDQALDHNLRTVQQTAEIERHIREVEAELAELDQRRAEVAAILTRTKQELEKDIAARTSSAQLPRQRSTLKQEVGVVVRYGRLYVWHRYSPSGQKLGLNETDFVVVSDEGSHLETAPKPYAGVPITTAPESQARLHERMMQFDSHRDYVAVVIYPDSFDKFQILKGVLIKAGFEYRLMPSRPGDPIADRGGAGGKVQ